MNRMLWGIAFLVVATGGWAQSTWRGQAEVWPTASAPLDGYVAASNEFPRNSLLTVENYRTKKTIQVRVVAALPSGSAALVVLNAKAAQALDIKVGDSPLVGVRLDPTGIDRADNPDPDVNPLAAKPTVPAVALAPVPVPVPVPSPALVPAPAPTTPPANVAPLPVLANPEPVAEPSAALAVADETEAPTPVTPGKKVFLTTRDPEPVATETPPEVVAATAPASTPAVAEAPEPAATPDVATDVTPDVAPVPAPVPTPAAVAAAPVPAGPPAAGPVAVAEPAAEPAAVPVAPVPAAPLAVKPAPASAWVPVPGKLEGPVLGQVPVLPGLDKGKVYVQVGSFATEGDVLASLGAVRSYVPVAVYKAEGEKNPWRVVVAAPKSQLGVLLMYFRSQGYRTASVVKGS